MIGFLIKVQYLKKKEKLEFLSQDREIDRYLLEMKYIIFIFYVVDLQQINE